jgi:hypothetical protein
VVFGWCRPRDSGKGEREDGGKDGNESGLPHGLLPCCRT